MKTENQGTTIDSINYDNIDNAKIIEEALKETEVLDLEKEVQEQYQEPPQQMYQQPPPQQMYQQPPPQQMYQQPPQQMYQQQPPQQMYQQPLQQMYQQPQQNDEISPLSKFEKNNGFLKNFQHSFILLIVLILFNNDLFKSLISKIPFTTDVDGNQNFLLFFLLFIFIFFVYFIYLTIFN